jgi:hypothetical protein
MSYSTVHTTITVHIDTKHRHHIWLKDPLSQPKEVGPTFQITGTIEVEVSITRDNGYYGGRSDDYPGDPDEVTVEDYAAYELWVTNLDEDPESEGTRFTHENPILNPQLIYELIPDTADLEVSYDDCDDE